jgi:hypothetical protein
VIVTSLFNNNPHFITGQRGRKHELGSPPITIKTATEEFLGLQLNAARIVRCVLWHFVHYAKQCSNEPAQRNEETAAQFVLVQVCCIDHPIQRKDIFNGSSPLRSRFVNQAIQHLKQKTVITSIFNGVFQHQGIDSKLDFPVLNVSGT